MAEATELAQPLVPKGENAGNSTSPASKLPQFVFVTPNPNDPGQAENLAKEISVEEAVDRIYHILKTSKEGADSTFRETKLILEEASKHMTIFQKKPEEKVTEKTFVEEAVALILWICRDLCGFEINTFLSRDQDEIFFKIRCDDDHLLQEAIRVHYRLQMLKSSQDQRKRFGFMKVAPYIPLDANVNLAIFPRFDEEGNASKDGSIFSPLDRSRLVKSLITRFLSISDLEGLGIFVQDFCVHDPKPLNVLNSTWSSLKCIFCPQPIKRIRRYFGEEIALYFCWIGFYLMCMFFPAVLGLGLFVVEKVSDKVHSGEGEAYTMYEIGLFVFCLFLALWASFFDQLWLRHEKQMAWKWGVTNFEEEEAQRTAYNAPVVLDEVSNTYRKKSPGLWMKIKQMISFYVAFMCISCVVVAVFGIFIYRGILITQGEASAGLICGLLNAVQIKIMNIVYTKVAQKMNDWENHETESQANDSYAVKLFLFRFVNSYISLFYVAFVKAEIESCGEDNCMAELRMQLGTIFITNLCMNVVELGMPWLKHKLRVWMELRKVRKLNAEGQHLREEMSYVEAQAKLEPYENPLEDYMEMVVEYGYVVLFSASFPIVPVLAVIEILLEIRVDAWKLCSLTRRPFPDQAEDIGVWFYIIQTVSFIGAITNAGLIVFTARIFHGVGIQGQWLVFMGIEHLLLLCKFLISIAVPDQPTVVKKGLAWSQRIMEETKGEGQKTDAQFEIPVMSQPFALPADISSSDDSKGH